MRHNRLSSNSLRKRHGLWSWGTRRLWSESELRRVVLGLEFKALQPRLPKYQSAIAHRLAPASSLLAPFEIIRAFWVGLNFSIYANQIAQLASRFDNGRAELPVTIYLDFLDQVDTSETKIA